MTNREYYSNCLFEAIKAKIKWGKRVKIIYIPSWKNEVFCPHFIMNRDYVFRMTKEMIYNKVNESEETKNEKTK